MNEQTKGLRTIELNNLDDAPALQLESIVVQECDFNRTNGAITTVGQASHDHPVKGSVTVTV